MNLLDRYIFRSVLFTCIGAVALFSFVLMLGNVIRDLLSYVLAGQLPLATFGRLVLLLIPAVATYALPMGMLTGVLLTLGRLSADSEITAMRAAGLSLVRIATPVILLAVLGVASGLYVNFHSMPRANVLYHRELAQAVRANPLRVIVPKTFIDTFKGCIVYVGEKQGTLMRDFWLWQFASDTDRRIVKVVHAESGRFEYDEAANELVLVLIRAQVETRNPKSPENFTESPKVASFEQSEPMRFALDRVFGRATVRQKLRWMTLEELGAERRRLAAKQVPPAQEPQLARERLQVSLALHDKINLALAVLSFALIGVPLGIKVSRRETSANLGLAVGLALSYYFLTVMVRWLDRRPELHPDLLLWLPNGLYLCLGAWLLYRVEHGKA